MIHYVARQKLSEEKLAQLKIAVNGWCEVEEVITEYACDVQPLTDDEKERLYEFPAMEGTSDDCEDDGLRWKFCHNVASKGLEHIADVFSPIWRRAILDRCTKDSTLEELREVVNATIEAQLFNSLVAWREATPRHSDYNRLRR